MRDTQYSMDVSTGHIFRKHIFWKFLQNEKVCVDVTDAPVNREWQQVVPICETTSLFFFCLTVFQYIVKQLLFFRAKYLEELTLAEHRGNPLKDRHTANLIFERIQWDQSFSSSSFFPHEYASQWVSDRKLQLPILNRVCFVQMHALASHSSCH